MSRTCFINSIFAIVLMSQSACAQKKVNAFYLGHSLSDPIIDRIDAMVDHHEELDFSFRYQTNPGSSLKQSWEIKGKGYPVNNPFYAGYYHEQYGLPTGKFDVFVLTESVLRRMDNIHETYQYADSFYTFAARHNPDIQIYLYEVWHCINSGTPTACPWDVDANTWRPRLDDDLPMWESVVDTLNSRFKPKKPVRLIPGGQGMAALYDAVIAGTVPGVSSLDDLFSDDIHINGIASYFVSCIHFATIYGQSPVGLPNELTSMWGDPFDENPTPEQASRLQEIAWHVVQNYQKSAGG